jgi:GNAT superfamily N-acetyltransferase
MAGGKGGVELRAAGHRIALRPLTKADVPLVAPWFTEAKAALSDRRDLLAITEGKGGDPIGVLRARRDQPYEGALTIDSVVLEGSHRGRGLGREAIVALEAEAARRGIAQRFLAVVDASQGRALYFWLRLGYRPLLASEVRWLSRPGVVWMVRET